MTPEDIRKVQSDKPAQSLVHVHLVFGNAGMCRSCACSANVSHEHMWQVMGRHITLRDS